MTAFIIFGASLLVLTFFLLSVICKLLLSAVDAVLESGITFIYIIIAVAAVVLVLIFLTSLITSLIENGLWGTIKNYFLMIVLISIVLGAIYALGGALVILLASIVLQIAVVVFSGLLVVLEALAAVTEKGYIKFLTVIMNQVDRC